MPLKLKIRQRGAVLIVSLIMLAVMSLFVVSMLRTSIMELKIGGASHAFQINCSNAEFAVNTWINDNNGRLAHNFLTLTPALSAGCNVNTVGAAQCNDPPVVYGGTVVVTPTQINCGERPRFGDAIGPGALNAVWFDIRATATGTLGGTTVIHQGAETTAPAGSC